MGAYLSTPVMTKEIEEGENECVRFAAASMQGWRVHQEDAHNCILDFDENCSLFAVYDGHGGSEVATYIAQNFPNFLKECKLLQSENIKSALQKSFLDFDRTLYTDKVINLMSAFKEGDKTPKSEKSDGEEKEALFEEAIALSKEADISLDTLIKQYTKISRKLQDESVLTDVTRTEKRALGEPSSRLVKRRRIHRENTTTEDDDQSEENGDTHLEESSKVEPSEEKLFREQVNGNNEKVEDSGDASMECDYKKSQENGVTQLEQAPKENINGNFQKVEAPVDAFKVSSMKAAHSSSSKEDLNESVTEEDDEEDEDYSAAEDDEIDAAEDSEGDSEDENIPMSLGKLGQNKPGYDSGATACLALLFKEKVIVANVGDSRAVLCRDGKAVDLSVDHKPEDTKEKGRIEAAGGIVSDDGRVNGGLNLSRALGDHFYKQKSDFSLEDQMITPLPDVEIATLSDKDTLLVVACDGIWNSMNSQEVIDYINARIDTKSLKDIATEICSHCCASDTSGDGTGCDNMTIIILDLVKNQRAKITNTDLWEKKIDGEETISGKETTT